MEIIVGPRGGGSGASQNSPVFCPRGYAPVHSCIKRLAFNSLYILNKKKTSSLDIEISNLTLIQLDKVKKKKSSSLFTEAET